MVTTALKVASIRILGNGTIETYSLGADVTTVAIETGSLGENIANVTTEIGTLELIP